MTFNPTSSWFRQGHPSLSMYVRTRALFESEKICTLQLACFPHVLLVVQGKAITIVLYRYTLTKALGCLNIAIWVWKDLCAFLILLFVPGKAMPILLLLLASGHWQWLCSNGNLKFKLNMKRNDKIFTLPRFPHMLLVVYGKAVPVLLLLLAHCGHWHWFRLKWQLENEKLVNRFALYHTFQYVEC